jgi:RES domain-containing protein
VRFAGTAYRAHDPRWAFKPTSGEGAAIRGARFNPKGVPALYLGLSIVTAVKEANQGLAHRIDPCILCAYAVDCDDLVDLTDAAEREAHGIREADMACAWAICLAEGQRPPSWAIHDQLRAKGMVGIVVPSYAPGADETDRNLVLWDWSEDPPHRITVHDPAGRLPRDQQSWP